MSKLHLSFSINYKGEVSYHFWHEDGNGIVWNDGIAEGAKAHIDEITRAAGYCQEIQKAIKYLKWPT